jgi:hypothetical protein
LKGAASNADEIGSELLQYQSVEVEMERLGWFRIALRKGSDGFHD